MTMAALALAACMGPKSTQAPRTKDGKPILADIGDGKFQITLPYFEMAMTRVPVSSRYQYLTPEGKRQFLEMLAIEATYYLEGVRRKVFRQREFRNMLKLRLNAIMPEEARKELLKGITVTDDQVRAEWNAQITDKERYPFESVKDQLRARMTEALLDKAVEAKREELRKAWQVKLRPDNLEKLSPKNLQDGAIAPALDDALAEGTDYKYTVGQFLQRLDAAPADVREKIRKYPDPTQLLSMAVDEDVLSAWAEKQGFQKNIDMELRKKIIEVGTLSFATRSEIVGRDIFATPGEAKAYFDKHRQDYAVGDRMQTFPEVRDRVIAAVTEKKRDAATRSLAQSLMRHRFPIVYFEPNITNYLK
jgi:hypothetical protein